MHRRKCRYSDAHIQKRLAIVKQIPDDTRSATRCVQQARALKYRINRTRRCYVNIFYRLKKLRRFQVQVSSEIKRVSVALFAMFSKLVLSTGDEHFTNITAEASGSFLSDHSFFFLCTRSFFSKFSNHLFIAITFYNHTVYAKVSLERKKPERTCSAFIVFPFFLFCKFHFIQYTFPSRASQAATAFLLD